MTTLEELNQREQEELQLVREKYARLRQMVPHVCEYTEKRLNASIFGFASKNVCKHCGADMAAKGQA